MSDLNEQAPNDDRFWSCNIDRRGRLIRLIAGLLCLGGAAWCFWGTDGAFWASGLLALGVVSVFEGLRGWCIVRAFGFRTPW